MGYIYLITNLVNGKRYVGQTINTVSSRWKDHVDESRSESKRQKSILHLAMRKYGVHNFIVEELENCSEKELNEREKFYIKEFDTYYTHNKGYNMTWGGEGVRKYSDEEILYLWDQGYRNCEIAHLLGAAENTISARIKSLIGEESARERYANSRKIEIEQYDLYGNFIKAWNSMSEAEKALGLAQGAVTRCCTGERTVAGNYLWKKSNDNISIEELMIKYAKSSKCCSVDLIDDEGNIIKTYESGRVAEKELNIARGKVSEICWHKRGRKTANGYKFQWNYKIKRELADGIEPFTEKNS